jgi:hypothetical protein
VYYTIHLAAMCICPGPWKRLLHRYRGIREVAPEEIERYKKKYNIQ